MRIIANNILGVLCALAVKKTNNFGKI